MKPDGEKNENTESFTKPSIRPVIGWMGSAELGDHNRCPSPKCTLQSKNDGKAKTCASFERNIDSIDPILTNKYETLEERSRSLILGMIPVRDKELTPRRFPEMIAAIPPRKLPSALARTLNQTIIL